MPQPSLTDPAPLQVLFCCSWGKGFGSAHHVALAEVRNWPHSFVLTRHGADPNVTNAFGEAILVPMCNDQWCRKPTKTAIVSGLCQAPLELAVRGAIEIPPGKIAHGVFKGIWKTWKKHMLDDLSLLFTILCNNALWWTWLCFVCLFLFFGVEVCWMSLYQSQLGIWLLDTFSWF